MKTTIELFIHQKPGEPQKALTCDMSEYAEKSWGHGVLLGVREVEVEFEPFDIDPTQALIASYEAQVVKERADSQVRVNLLLDKISKLKCIEHKPESE